MFLFYLYLYIIVIMTTNILHWNMRGFQSHYSYLRTLLSDTNSVITCLQETRFPLAPPSPPRGYTMYHKSGPQGRDGLDHGGVCILVKSHIGHVPHPLITDLQAVSIRCHLDRLYTICGLYLPPGDPLHIDQLTDLIRQLPPPFLLLGDFNARHPLWGDAVANPKGRIVESLLTDGTCGILNRGDPTHFHLGTRSLSCIDLSLCTLADLPSFSWSVLDDLYGSDHYPVKLSLADPSPIHSSPRFIFDRADWTRFAAEAKCSEDVSNFPTVDAAVNYFTTIVSTAADLCIPKSSGILRTSSVPWWNAELGQAHREKKAALRRFHRSRLVHDKVAFNRARAKFQYLLRKSQADSWRGYVSSLNSRTPITKVWQRVKKIQGRYGGSNRPVLQSETGLLTAPKAVADHFGSTLSRISEGLQCPTFIVNKRLKECRPVTFADGDDREYNVPFTVVELEDALQHCNNTAAGEDTIHYLMLKHLPEESVQFLVSLFNRIWVSDDFPSSWRTSVVLPFPKKGKDALISSNYRPIALTSCLCKLLEKIVNKRLIWFLESTNTLQQNQYGFRKCRSTTDALVRLDTFIKSAFARKEHVVAVFFDIEKAYDTSWKHHIVCTLQQTGCVGNLPRFIVGFLKDRVLKVKIGTVLSDPFPQQQGVPQGSVLSCSLFALAINGVIESLPANVESSLYVDDLVIFTKSSHLPTAERRIQLAVTKVNSWAQLHGFKFSAPKTVSMHLTRRRGAFPPLSLTLGSDEIRQVSEHKFLGLTLDSKLLYVSHLKSLRIHCLQALQLLRCISHQKWGADRTILLHMYRTLVRSRLDYACQVYASASQSALKMLDSIHHQALRLATGAFKSSPVISLYAETGEPSLHYRRNKLSLQLYVRLLSMPGTPAQKGVICDNMDHLFLTHPRLHTTFGFRARQLLTNFDVAQPSVVPSLAYYSLPDSTTPPQVCQDLFPLQKGSNPPLALRSLCEEHQETHRGAYPVYTDGSKSEAGVGIAAIFPEKILASKLPAMASVFTAELRAILLALAYMLRLPNPNYVLYSDSKSALIAVNNSFSPLPLVREIHWWIRLLSSRGKSVLFCWTPAHVGIKGNESADREAKAVVQTDNPIPSFCLPHRDYYSHFSSILRDRWQDSWYNVAGNKLRSIKSSVSVWNTSCRRDRHLEVVLARLRIGHTKLTHQHLMNGDPLPYCDGCIVPLTVHHILTECPEYHQQRANCFGSDGLSGQVSLANILGDNDAAVPNLFNFLYQSDLLHKI